MAPERPSSEQRFRSARERWDAALGPHRVERLVGPGKVAESRKLTLAIRTPSERVGKLSSRTRPVERRDRRRQAEDVELGRLVERERRNEPREVMFEAGRAREHRLQSQLTRRVRVEAAEHMAEVVRDEAHITAAGLAGNVMPRRSWKSK